MAKSYPSYTSQTFTGEVVQKPDSRDKAVKINSINLYQHFLNVTCKIGDHISIVLTNKRPKRSAKQNNYLHLYLSLIALSSGHTMEELKAWIKDEFLCKGISEVFSRKIRIVRSTTELNIPEFIELLERIEEKTGIPLPQTEPFLNPMSPAEFDKLKKEQKKIYSKLVLNTKIPKSVDK